MNTKPRFYINHQFPSIQHAAFLEDIQLLLDEWGSK